MRFLASVAASIALSVPLAAATVPSPPAGASTTTYLCKSAAYSCTLGGYSAASASRAGWAWRFYGGTWPSYNAYGPHNCTLYVAYRLARAGITLSWHGNGSEWAQLAGSHGALVNHTPTPGSVAQWMSGHVAYVESVSARGVVITDDNFSGSYTTRQLLTQSTNWPSYFLHFGNSAKPTPKPASQTTKPAPPIATVFTITSHHAKKA